jgi:hypothetical protein
MRLQRGPGAPSEPQKWPISGILCPRAPSDAFLVAPPLPGLPYLAGEGSLGSRACLASFQLVVSPGSPWGPSPETRVGVTGIQSISLTAST